MGGGTRHPVNHEIVSGIC